MSDKFAFSSAGQVHELELAMDRAGEWNPALVKELSSGDNLVFVREYLLGQMKIVPIIEDANRIVTLNATTIAVNLAATPKLLFGGAKVEQHIGGGWVIVEKRDDGLYVDGKKVTLHLSKRQKNGKRIKGYELREELTGKPVLNANILDALLIHTHLLPEDWQQDKNGNTRYIFFWGTIYRDSLGSLCVRCLCFAGGGWRSDYGRLDSGWVGNGPAALLAS